MMPAMSTGWPDLLSRFAARGHGVAFVIPAYNHGPTVRQVAIDAAATGCPVWLVDDGSTDETPRAVEGLDGVTAIRHEENMGKGAALVTGMTAAAGTGARWAVSVDADGQHVPAEALRLLAAVDGMDGAAIVLGRREGMQDTAIPWTSRFGRGFSNFWVRASGGPRVSDSQTGFRLYPISEVLRLPVKSRRFQFEVEVLVLAQLAGIHVIEVPVSVVYGPPGGRVSHFHPWRDFWRNSNTFTRLIARRLLGFCAPRKVDRDAP
jgi:glycosyltransferase involved in cell wall biosynthesis